MFFRTHCWTDRMASRSPPSQRRQTALACIAAYNQWSLPAIMSLRSDDCVNEILPKSLRMPPMDNRAYAAFFSGNMPRFRDFRVVVDDVVEDERGNKLVVWAHSTAATDVGPYQRVHAALPLQRGRRPDHQVPGICGRQQCGLLCKAGEGGALKGRWQPRGTVA
ncbi:hypothetical protein GGR56DRAFT_657149 [Xylariaceae sp. FL0804]|nr:hypothetical protein GGR56DRAFT_657149 [Xylariaceae sp. FL0804]